ncbi:hypothetical protein ACLO9V_26385, partial [Escherichia coli]
MKVVKVVKEQVLSTVISGIIGIAATVGLFHFTSQPIRSADVKWSTKTGHRVRVFSSIDFPIRLVVTHHYIRAVLVRCNIQR